jgi:hypothetical protein
LHLITSTSLYLQKEEDSEYLKKWIDFSHSLNLIPFICYKICSPYAYRNSGTPYTTLTFWRDKMDKSLSLVLYKGSKRILVQMFISITFNSFKNFSFRSLPVNKEYVYGNLGYELMQKLQGLKWHIIKHLKSSSINLVCETNIDALRKML